MNDHEQFIQTAIKHKGALTRKAKAAGMSPLAFAEQHQHADGITGKQARFALLLHRFTLDKKKAE